MTARSPTGVAEHILLESDDSGPEAVPDISHARKIQSHVKLRSRMRGGMFALDVFDYRYLAVHAKKLWSSPLAFVVDLRFVDADLDRRRIIPQRWWQGAASMVGLSAIGVGLFQLSPAPWSQSAWFTPLIILCAASACVVLLSAYLTTETVALRTRSGRAKLLEFTGGIGTFRAMRTFETKLAAHIRHALAASGRTKAQHLRDEMREHQRLREIGVLTEADYEDSKTRILRSHE